MHYAHNSKQKRKAFIYANRPRYSSRFNLAAIILLGLALLIALCWVAVPKGEATHDEELESPNDIKGLATQVSQNEPDTTEKNSFGNEFNRDDWRLVLVNSDNLLPKNYEPTLTQLENGHAIDERAFNDLQEMFNSCRNEGLNPLICSSYRSQEKQESLYAEKVRSLQYSGYSYEDALKEAGTVVAVPGTSEHQLGLALDIVDESNQVLDTAQEKTAVQQWLMKHSWEYGFTLRYPSDKCDITGIIYEPWHYRYVGKDAARVMYENGLCLEEYLEQLA